MNITPGTRFGPYEIVAPIGAGGMGEVFKARDTRLERSVAIKVLPSDFATNPSLKLRFEREAKTISQLNHPHICTLHDVGSENGVAYLVMELLEGETLADRIARGPLPLSEVLRYGAQIAEALDRAHRAGITHRDLKPGNVMITKSGAKLLDFGLAKENESDAVAALTNVRTEKKPLTEEGTIVGTFQYMAPEQVEGQVVDARTDIFAFGAVLFEMATGRRAFTGKSKASLIASILTTDPPSIASIQPLTPPALDRVVRTCLEKDPDDRWQSAHDLRLELQAIAELGSQAGVAAPLAGKRRRREWLLRAALLVCAVATIVLATLYIREKLAPRPHFVASIQPPAGLNFNATGDAAGPIVISPDGQYVVFSAGNNVLRPRLFLRSLSSGETKEIGGTEGGMFPFWAPDSKNIGFFQTGRLKRTDISGGAPMDLCDAPSARGGAWSPDNIILFTPSTTASIFRISAAGGTPVAVTRLDATQHTTHRWPEYLADGRHFVYLAANHRAPTSSANALYLGSIDGRENRRLFNSVSSAVHASGSLLYGRDNVLYAQKLSSKWTLDGDPIRIADRCLYDPGIWRTGASASRGGVLVFNSGTASLGSQVAWFDRTGKKIADLGSRDAYFDLHLSPDQKKLAMGLGDPGRQVWVYDLERNVPTRITFNADYAGTPAWSRDGKNLYYTRILGKSFAVVSQSAASGRLPRVIWEMPPGEIATVHDVSPDGRYITVDHANRLLIIDTATGKVAVFYDRGRQGKFSPDGRWLAYTSDENGSVDVFITSFPDRRSKWQVSAEGAVMPMWRRDGKELFFYTERGALMAVPITAAGDDLEIGVARSLFEIPLKRSGGGTPYDVSADGQRILANFTAIESSGEVTLVSDWFPLRKRAH